MDHHGRDHEYLRLAAARGVCDNGGDPRRLARVCVEEDTMGKTGRKRRARKKKGANHGKRPNA
jgi:hypothetical protein